MNLTIGTVFFLLSIVLTLLIFKDVSILILVVLLQVCLYIEGLKFFMFVRKKYTHLFNVIYL